MFGSAADAGQDPGQLSLEPARPGSELSARINAVLGALRGQRELYQARGIRGGG